MSHDALAVVSRGMFEERSPAARVIYDEAEEGFLLLDADMPKDPAGTREEDLHVVCLACPLERHLEAGAGMDVAMRSGAARLVDGAWIEEKLD